MLSGKCRDLQEIEQKGTAKAIPRQKDIRCIIAKMPSDLSQDRRFRRQRSCTVEDIILMENRLRFNDVIVSKSNITPIGRYCMVIGYN